MTTAPQIPTARRPRRTPRAPVPTWVWWVIGIVAVVLVAFVVLLSASAIFGTAGRSEPPPGVPHDPENAQPVGSRAIVSILDEHGVDVRLADGVEEFADAPRPGADTTVVVSSPSRFNPATAQQFTERVRGAGRIVVVAPAEEALALLELPVVGVFGSPQFGGVEAGCTTPQISPTDRITAQYSGYATDEPRAARCFTADGASNLLVLPATPNRPEVVVVSGDLLTNQDLALFDNAGVAVRILGSTGEVLWYTPRFTDSVAGDEQATDSDIPAALGPLIVLAAFGVLALMLWRGRRFGALVTEPLPAVVKAIETTQARGRMYRRAGADTRAAAALRIRTLASLAKYLGLPYDAGRATDELARPDWELGATPMSGAPSVQAIATTVADVTRRDPTEVHALLAGPLPADPAGLVHFTRELTALEQEVRSTP